MRKLRIIIPIVIVVVTVSIFSLTVVFAQVEEGGSNPSKLAIKVAEILGLDVKVVDDAINRSRKELRNEAVQNKSNVLGKKGQLTQEQVDKHLDWIKSKREGMPAIGKHSFGEKGHHPNWKGHGRSFGPKDYFRVKLKALQNEKTD